MRAGWKGRKPSSSAPFASIRKTPTRSRYSQENPTKPYLRRATSTRSYRFSHESRAATRIRSERIFSPWAKRSASGSRKEEILLPTPPPWRSSLPTDETPRIRPIRRASVRFSRIPKERSKSSPSPSEARNERTFPSEKISWGERCTKPTRAVTRSLPSRTAKRDDD